MGQPTSTTFCQKGRRFTVTVNPVCNTDGGNLVGIYVYIRTYMCFLVYLYVFTYVCMYVYMYVCILKDL